MLPFFRKKPAGPAAKRPPKRGAWTAVFETAGRILYEAGPDSFAGRTIVVGRNRGCDWCTAGIDETLSSRHAELTVRRGALVIRDLDSRNGLYFRGERIKEHRFAPGDTVLLGSCKITVEAVRASDTADGPSFHRLERLNGPDAGAVIELGKDGAAEIAIGSDPGCEIHCFDTLVSHRHAVLSFKKDGSCWLRDAGSRNGTTVNGTALAKDKERMLRDGDIVGIAHLEFRFLDKDVVHVRAGVGRKLLVAAATVAVAVMGFSLWNAVRTGSGYLLSKSLRAAESWSTDQTDFSAAFEILAQATTARDADLYQRAIRDRYDQLSAWTNTIVTWRAVRADLSRGKWRTARQRFNNLSSWTWNATDAPVAHREAEAVQKLVGAFLDCREHLTSTDWSVSGVDEIRRFSADADRLDASLADAPDPNRRKWIAPVVSEARALLEEFRIETNELSLVSASLEPLVPTAAADPAPDAARRAAAALDDMLAANAERGRRRRNETVAFGGGTPLPRPVPFFSKAVEVCASAARQPLDGFASAELDIENNIRLIAEAKWTSVRTELKLPTRSVTDARTEFMRYREFLERKNAALCGETVLGEWKNRLESLRRHGFDFESGAVPAVFSELDDATLPDRILSFVPAGIAGFDGSSTAPVCDYDRFAGVQATTKYLQELKRGRSQSLAAAEYDKFGVGQTSKRPWRTTLQALREELRMLRSFNSFASESDHPLVRLVRQSDVSGNRCREAAVFVAGRIRRVENWKESFVDRCLDSDGERERILADVVDLLLERRPDDRKAKELGTRYGGLSDRVWDVSDAVNRGELDPSAGWGEIFRTALPSDEKPFVDALRWAAEQRGRTHP